MPGIIKGHSEKKKTEYTKEIEFTIKVRAVKYFVDSDPFDSAENIAKQLHYGKGEIIEVAVIDCKENPLSVIDQLRMKIYMDIIEGRQRLCRAWDVEYSNWNDDPNIHVSVGPDAGLYNNHYGTGMFVLPMGDKANVTCRCREFSQILEHAKIADFIHQVFTEHECPPAGG